MEVVVVHLDEGLYLEEVFWLEVDLFGDLDEWDAGFQILGEGCWKVGDLFGECCRDVVVGV